MADFSLKDDPNKSQFNFQQPVTVGFKTPETNFSNVSGIPKAQTFNDPKASLEYKTRALYSKGSPMLDSVRTQVKQGGEARGLLNSMGNLGAGESAVLSTAAQIAAPDSASEQGRLNMEQQQIYGAGNSVLGAQLSGALAQQQQDFQSGMQKYNNEFQDYLADKGYDANKIEAFSKIYAQGMQDDFEKVVNATKPWLGSLFDIPLS